jgi:hypothetical protein
MLALLRRYFLYPAYAGFKEMANESAYFQDPHQKKKLDARGSGLA